MQHVELAEDVAHPAAYDGQRWARGVGLTCAFDLQEGDGGGGREVVRWHRHRSHAWHGEDSLGRTVFR